MPGGDVAASTHAAVSATSAAGQVPLIEKAFGRVTCLFRIDLSPRPELQNQQRISTSVELSRRWQERCRLCA